MADDAEHRRLVGDIVAPGVVRCEIDGVDAGAAQLDAFLRLQHGHYTSLQVRDGAVRGLDLHLTRLQDATRELYGADLDAAHVRALLRHALRDAPDAGVRVVVFAPDWTLRAMPSPARIATLIQVSPPTPPQTHPLRVCSIEYTRFLPHIKHVATFPLLELRRRAQAAGSDDALFVDADGRIGEGSTWNLGAFDGTRVLWPQAPQLHGTAMRVLARALAAAGIASEQRVLRRDDLAGFSVFACNATTPAQPIVAIDGLALPCDATLLQRLDTAHAAEPALPI